MTNTNDSEDVSRRSVLRTVGGGVGAVALGGQATAMQDDEEPERTRDRPDEHIIGLEQGTAPSLATESAANVKRELDFEDVGKAVVGEFSEQALQSLERNANVRYVERNGLMHALEQTTPYGIEQVEADVAIDQGETGEDVSVAVVDTGVDANHETLESNLGEGFAPAGAACQDDCQSGYFCNPNDIDTCYEPWDDDNDHGTHVAGTVGAADNGTGVLGVAPDVTIHPVKVLDCCGSGTNDDIAAGIEWSADQGADVINMSLGGGYSNVIEDAVQYAANRGVVIVAAAGNDGPCTDCVGYPAALPEVIAVSATDENDDLASFSSTGPEIDLAAPGNNVLSSIPRDDYAEFPGTSMASPHVAGAAAQVIADGTTDREAVRDTLTSTADDVGLADNEQGDGRVNVARALDIGDGGGGGGGDGEFGVTTGSASGVDTSSATLNGDLTGLGDADEAEVWFEYGVAGSDLPNTTSSQALSSAGSFSESVTGLDDATSYEFQAVAEADGDQDTGTVSSFTTDTACFITTATHRQDRTLDSLRRFRDESMSATPVGRGLVGLYYRISPPIADTLQRHPESQTTETCRSIIQRCADLSDRQDETGSRLESALLGVALTTLYVLGVLVAASGHAGIRTRELLGD